MSQSSQPSSPSSVDAAQTATLNADLAAARDQLSRATAEHETMLADQDSIQEDRDATAQLVAEARAGVARVEAALLRAADGTYGRCRQCGSAIPQERLDVLPDASTCVACA